MARPGDPLRGLVSLPTTDTCRVWQFSWSKCAQHRRCILSKTEPSHSAVACAHGTRRKSSHRTLCCAKPLPHAARLPAASVDPSATHPHTHKHAPARAPPAGTHSPLVIHEIRAASQPVRRSECIYGVSTPAPRPAAVRPATTFARPYGAHTARQSRHVPRCSPSTTPVPAALPPAAATGVRPRGAQRPARQRAQVRCGSCAVSVSRAWWVGRSPTAARF